MFIAFGASVATGQRRNELMLLKNFSLWNYFFMLRMKAVLQFFTWGFSAGPEVNWQNWTLAYQTFLYRIKSENGIAFSVI